MEILFLVLMLSINIFLAVILKDDLPMMAIFFGLGAVCLFMIVYCAFHLKKVNKEINTETSGDSA